MLQSALLSLLTLTLAAQTPAPAPKQEAPKAPAAAAAPAPKPEAKPKEDKILAKIGSKIIRESDVQLAIDVMPPQQQAQLNAMAGGREKFTQNFIEFQTLAAKARANGIDKTDLFKRQAALNLDQLLASELLKKDGEALQKKLQITDDEVKAYFEKNQAKYTKPESFSARHILVKIKGGRNGEEGLTEEAAKAKIAKIQDEFKKGGKWDDLAKQYSEDPGSKDKGGLYENISYGSFVPEFDAAVKAQEVGKVGEPVKTMFGYHLIQVEKKNASQPQTFDEAKDRVKQQMATERQEQVWHDYVGGIQKEMGVLTGDAAAKAAAAEPKAPAAPAKAAKKTGAKK